MMMATEYYLKSIDGLHAVSGYVCDHFDGSDKGLKLVITESEGTGKWGMARLWRKWMSETADFMALNGATMPLMLDKEGKQYGSRPFQSQDAHELFTSQWLGLNDKGQRLSWKKSDGENVADKGQRFIALMRHEEWCIEKGVNLSQPRESEFNQLKDEQND